MSIIPTCDSSEELGLEQLPPDGFQDGEER